MSKEKRVIYYDILNILAIIAVITMHCNGIVHGNPNTRAWNFSLIIECICYWAVPVFIMLSGANLLNYREKYDTKHFFKKRILKVLIPFVFWALIMFIWKKCTGQINANLNSIKDYANFFLSNKEEPTYYFIFEILGIYLTMPLLSRLAKKEYRGTLWLTVGIFFVFNATIPNILGLFQINWNSSFSVKIGGWIIYVIIGYLLSTQDLTKKQKAFIYIFAIVGLIYRYLTTFYLSKIAGTVVKTTWGYTSWHCILLASSVFLIVKDLKLSNLENNTIQNLIQKTSSCSLGIYLIHMIVRYYEIKLLNINTVSWQFRTIGVLTTYLISLIIVYLLKKIPIIKRIVP